MTLTHVQTILTGTRTSLTCLAYQGKRRGHRISDNPFNLSQYDVVVTSYRTCCLDEVRNVTCMKKRVKNNGKKENQGWISQTSKSTAAAAQNNRRVGSSRLHCVEWQRVVADEVHEIKNKRTKRYKCVNALVSLYRWGMTATPIGNSTKELNTLLQWISGGTCASNDAVLCESEITQCCMSGASALPSFGVVMLRRSQEAEQRAVGATVALPPMHTRTIRCTMRSGGIQYAIYRQLLKETKKHLRKNRNKIHVFELLLRLRQAANHPSLIADAVNKGNTQLQKALRISSDSDFDDDDDDDDDDFAKEQDEMAILDKGGMSMDVPRARDGTKLRQLLKLTKEWKRNGEKFVIFSQWTSMLHVCRVALEERGYVVTALEGSMSLEEREQAVRQCAINKKTGKVDGMLISLKAGGQGLNLTCFSKVILMEPHYNPSVEEQAIGRVMRMGQKHASVEVVRLITKMTVEMDILKIQEKKKKHVDRLMANKKQKQKNKKTTMINKTNMMNMTNTTKSMATNMTTNAQGGSISDELIVAELMKKFRYNFSLC